MESVGQKLRQARLCLGLTLDDVSARTCINLKNLNAIEAGELAAVSSRFLYKSFVRQIADVVGISSEIIEPLLQQEANSIPEPLVPGQPGAPIPPKLKSLTPEPMRISRWVSALALLVVMLAACSTLYAMWQQSRSNQNRAVSAPAPSASIPAVKSEPASASVSALQVAKTAPPAAPVPRDTFQIELSVLERTWLSVAADGKEVYTGVLQAAEKKTLAGKENARIRTGNAGGVEVSFNGKNLGPLGSHGQVLTVVFDKNGYQVLEPQARVTLVGYHSTGE